MGYRFDNRPPLKPDDLCPVFDAYNGAQMVWSFPCFYFEVEQPIDWHDHKSHDHFGWPYPRHPDQICQGVPSLGVPSPNTLWEYVDMDKAKKIHLLSEYEDYSGASIVFDTVDEHGNEIDLTGVNADILIRNIPEDWVIDIIFAPTIDDFAGKPKEFMFNTYLQMGELQEIFFRGKLLVLPGPALNGFSDLVDPDNLG